MSLNVTDGMPRKNTVNCLISAAALLVLSVFIGGCQTTGGGPSTNLSGGVDQVALLKKKEEEARINARKIMADAALLANKGHLRSAIETYQAALAPAEFSATEGLKTEILDHIAVLTGRLAAPPAVSDEARRFGIRGETLLQGAKNQAAFQRAAKEFEAAVDAAPWWSSAYYNLALAREGALDAAGAIQAYKHFLSAEPAAQEAATIRDRMIALEVIAEEQARKNAWTGYWRSSTGSLLRTNLKNNVLNMVEFSVSDKAKESGYHNGQVIFSGTLSGDTVTGKTTMPQCFEGAHFACKRCFPGFRQVNASYKLDGLDTIVVSYNDTFMDRFNTSNCAVLATKRIQGEYKYKRDKKAERTLPGS